MKKGVKKISLLAHEMVPEHIILDEDEIKEMLQIYSVDREHLPKIRANDPVAVEIGAEKGDVVKIIRKSETAGSSNTYRYVI